LLRIYIKDSALQNHDSGKLCNFVGHQSIRARLQVIFGPPFDGANVAVGCVHQFQETGARASSAPSTFDHPFRELFSTNG
jgi:hypothetical protein